MMVEKKFFELSRPFITEGGKRIEKPILAYEEYGNPDGPVVLILHGGLSSQHAAGKYSEDDMEPGWWDDVIGAGKGIDTNIYRVLSFNALGSSFGSSNPLSMNPKTRKHYGPDFPEITMIDMARFHKACLDEMGVEKLFMSAGPSMGSLESLQLAALYPNFVGSVVSVATAGRMTPYGMGMHHFIINMLKADPGYNDGWYDISNPPKQGLRAIHQVARLFYTSEAIVRKINWDESSQENRSEKVANYLTAGLEEHILGRDPNSYIKVVEAINSFDLANGAENFEKGVQRIKCPVMLVNISSDSEFPSYWGAEVAEILNNNNPGQARAEVVHSDWGHLGCIKEGKVVGEKIKEFICEVL